jgi:hypothetical protein
MKMKINEILKNSFYQLLAVYTLLIILISFNLFWKYSLQMSIFALVVAILGISIISKNSPKDTAPHLHKRLHLILFILAILIIIGFRFIPYVTQNSGQTIPLGYDAGIYKYGIESFNSQGFGVADWIKGAMTPGFLYLMFVLGGIFSIGSILTDLFILMSVILGVSIYFVTKEYFGKNTGLIAFLLYAISIIQFKVFTFMYYKNVIGLALALWAIYFLKKDKRILFILFGALTGIMHRPTFYILGLSYFLYAIFDSLKDKKFNYKRLIKNGITGIEVLILTSILYIGFFRQAIIPLINPVLQGFVNTGTAPGTFISFFQYQFSTLAYLPFALLGFFALLKQKKFNMIFFWTLICAMIVYFQFFFFNRFIIHLDIGLIVLAAVGFSTIIQHKKKFGVVILILMLFSAGFVALNEARDAKPLISESELNLIKELENTEKDAYVMVISSEYSPWVLGYSGRKTIAPGLFDENKWDEEQWNRFWISDDKQETIGLMSVYDTSKPIYLFAGNKAFDNPCFEIYNQDLNNKVYRYIC